MGKTLVIVESPSKAKTVGKYLGSDYTVKASVGHVRDLPKSNKNAVDIARGFKPHYEIVKKKENVVEEIAAAARKSSEVLLATDPDREGEAIAWHIAELLRQKSGGEGRQPKIRRIAYHEITKEAIEEALRHPRDIDQNLRRAQEARRVLDRLVGYDLSGLIWKKIRYGLSAGRVQSPALRILVEREREIRAFKPQKFWTITATVKTTKGEKFELLSATEPTEKSKAEEIVALGRKSDWKVSAVEETEAKRAPRPPFITSTLQQAASSRFGMSPARTMAVAQKLYEAGLITYMRTDSFNLSEGARREIAAAVGKNFGAEHHENRSYTAKVKNAQEAHEAIRPTHFTRAAAGQSPEQRKLFELIWRRAVSSQMADAKLLKTKITAAPAGGGEILFSANGSRLLYPGWLLADPASRGDDVELPKVAAGEKLELVDIKADEKETAPPPRYSEAGLIKELEKRGIGRPSTYATIMETLLRRGYAARENRSLAPTDTGMVVSGFLEEHFPSYISDTFTAEMEDELDDIALGKREYEKTLGDFYIPFHADVKSKEKLDKATTLGSAPKEFRCPACGGAMVWKLGRSGRFLSCGRFPECEGALTAEGKVLPKSSEPIGRHPENGEPIFVKNGRFGPYVQMGNNSKTKDETGKNVPPKQKPKMASIPKEINPADVTVETAVKLLSLPRVLGQHPETGKEVAASRGRFGPYVVHDGNFRSVRAPDDVYTIELPRALALLAEKKKSRPKKSAP